MSGERAKNDSWGERGEFVGSEEYRVRGES